MHENAFGNFGSRTGSCWRIRSRFGSQVNEIKNLPFSSVVMVHSCRFFFSPVRRWRGGTSSTWLCWHLNAIPSSMPSVDSNGPWTAWAWSSITSSVSASWMLARWSRWLKHGDRFQPVFIVKVAPWCNPSKNFWSTHYHVTMKLSLTKRISFWAHFRPIPTNGSLILTLDTRSCQGSETEVDYLEHVQAVISLNTTRRGEVEMFLTSPMGTR